jgi:hypothetical protein
MSATSLPATEAREARALDERIHAAIARAAASWSLDSETLDRLLLDVFAHQVRWNPAYARYAARRGGDLDRVATPADIPPIPARAFTRLRMATFPPEQTIRRFRSSGTTGGPRAVLELSREQLALYDSALLPPFRRFLLPGRELAWVALVADPRVAPESSLSAMLGSAARQLGSEVAYFGVAGGGIDVALARAALETHSAKGTPVLLLATALALDALASALARDGARLPLPPGSRVMETGGFKGRKKELERGALVTEIAARLDVPAVAVIGEYGMTEMTSQFYDPAFYEHVTGATPGPRRMAAPPWVKTRIVDPITLADVPSGEPGLLLHLDPAARSSAVALLTEDCGRQVAGGFELLGRMPGAEPRGCSLAVDDLVRASEPGRSAP